jgi:hypothetical protein
MNKNHLALITALALIGCKDKGDSAATQSGCTIEVDAEYPVDGQADVYYRADIEFSLSEADSSASISVTDSSGAAVSGTSSLNDDGDYVTFTPDAAMSPSSSYTATITSCDGGQSADIGFTTSSLGTEMSADPTGKTFVVDLASGRFVKPAGVGDLIGGLLENSILIGVISADTELAIRGAISEDTSTAQDTCNPTLDDFPNADFSDSPYFVIPEGDVTIAVAGVSVQINSMSISGTFAEDATYFGGGTVSGEIDARDLGPLLEGQVDDTSPDYLCSLLAGFGVACITCASDGEPYCATLQVVDLIAEEQDGEIIPVEAENCHETCADSCDNAECAEASKFEVCN